MASIFQIIFHTQKIEKKCFFWGRSSGVCWAQNLGMMLANKTGSGNAIRLQLGKISNLLELKN